MKALFRTLIAAAFVFTAAFQAHAQYYEMANQAINMVQPALNGSFNYRGFVDVSYTGGIGKNGCNSLEFSTTQGLKYSNWFFMGVGAGVNIVFAGEKDTNHPEDYNNWGNGYDPGYSWHDTGVVIPLYTDFRFNIGKETDISFFADVRLGASFLVGKNYLRTPEGLLSNNEGFYFKPTIGVRIPVNGKNSKQAINVGVSYQLITNNYWNWSGYYQGTTVNSLGASVGFEW